MGRKKRTEWKTSIVVPSKLREVLYESLMRSGKIT